MEWMLLFLLLVRLIENTVVAVAVAVVADGLLTPSSVCVLRVLLPVLLMVVPLVLLDLKQIPKHSIGFSENLVGILWWQRVQSASDRWVAGRGIHDQCGEVTKRSERFMFTTSPAASGAT